MEKGQPSITTMELEHNFVMLFYNYIFALSYIVIFITV